MSKPSRPGSQHLRLNGWERQRVRALYLRLHPLCEACEAEGRISEATELDHRIPLSEGGTHDWSNLAGLCRPCHDAKTRRERGLTDKGCDIHGNPTGGWKA